MAENNRYYYSKYLVYDEDEIMNQCKDILREWCEKDLDIGDIEYSGKTNTLFEKLYPDATDIQKENYCRIGMSVLQNIENVSFVYKVGKQRTTLSDKICFDGEFLSVEDFCRKFEEYANVIDLDICYENYPEDHMGVPYEVNTRIPLSEFICLYTDAIKTAFKKERENPNLENLGDELKRTEVKVLTKTESCREIA